MKRIILVAMLAQIGSTQQDPHLVARCTVTGEGGSAPCACLRQVDAIQQDAIKVCMDQYVTRKDLIKCLGAVPDHCEVMHREHAVEDWQRHRGPDMSYQCSTRCKPERCGCNMDRPCKAHGEEDETGYTAQPQQPQPKKKGRKK